MNMLLIFLFLNHSPHNQDILSYAESNIGRKVGYGVCRELIDSAIASIDHTYIKKHRRNYYYDLKKIKMANAKPGDMLLLSRCYLDGSKDLTVGHIAIIKSVDGNKITVFEQNTDDKLKNSIVVESVYDISTIVPHRNGGVYFCRFR